MTTRTLTDLAKKMRDIDITMLSTLTPSGDIAGRPMSNNRQVDYDGDSCYFTWEKADMVAQAEANPKVSLAFQGSKRFLVAVEGRAELVRDKQAFASHWTPDLDKWFDDGIDTDGLVMIKVHATRIHWWDGEDEGEIKV